MCVDRFIDRCREEVCNIRFDKQSSKRSNISSTELQCLRKRDDIVIKPADKGGAIVVWRKDLYIEEANRHLSDETFYRKETRDMTRENFKIVEEAIKQEIEEEHLPGSATALLPKDLRCSLFVT